MMQIDLKDLAALVALLKLYRSDLYQCASDNFELGHDFDYKEVAQKIEKIENALDVAFDDLKYRLES